MVVVVELKLPEEDVGNGCWDCWWCLVTDAGDIGAVGGRV